MNRELLLDVQHLLLHIKENLDAHPSAPYFGGIESMLKRIGTALTTPAPEVAAWSNCDRCGAAYLHEHPEADPAVVAEQKACEAAEWKNAERYRWLVANGIRIDITTEKQMFGVYGRELSAVLDVAMRDSSQPQNERPE